MIENRLGQLIDPIPIDPACVADSKGRRWNLCIDDDAAIRIRREVGIDLSAWRRSPALTMQNFADLAQVIGEGGLLLGAVWAILLPQGEAAGVTIAEFATGLNAATILAMQDALMDAIEGYLPGKRLDEVFTEARRRTANAELYIRGQNPKQN